MSVVCVFFCNTAKKKNHKNPKTYIKCVYMNSDTKESTLSLMTTCTNAFIYEFGMNFKQQ